MRSPIEWDPQTAIVLVLALSLSAVALVADDDSDAQAQLTCPNDDRLDHPLWITEVRPIERPDTDTDGTVIQDGTAFVNTSDRLEFEFEIFNRVPSDCDYTSDWSDGLRIATNYTFGDQATGWTSPPTLGRTHGTTGANSSHPHERCVIGGQDAVDLPTDVQGPAGEQRVRFVVFDTDANNDDDNIPDDCLPPDDTPDDPPGACAGAERVIVVERKPDLTVNSAENAIEGTLQVSSSHIDTSFDLNVSNEGTYPNWNPNGNRADDQFYGRSAFDSEGDGDLTPEGNEQNNDNETDYDASADNTPPSCHWLDSDADASNGYGCSYRRGDRMQIPFYHEVFERDEEQSNDDEEDEDLVETGQDDFYDTVGQMFYDKDHRTVIQHEGNEAGQPHTRETSFATLDRFRRAGYFNLSIQVDYNDTTGSDNVPEHLHYEPVESGDTDDLDERNNDVGNSTVNVIGPDLAIHKPRIRLQAPSGVRDYGDDTLCPKSNRCNVSDTTVKIDTFYRNVGNNESAYDAPSQGHDVQWEAAAYLNGDIALTANGDPDDPDDYANFTKNRIAFPEDGTQEVFSDDPPSEEDDYRGGKQILKVQLDHEDNYQDRAIGPDDQRGFAGEREENFTYPCDATDVEEEELDNTFCVTLWFKNEQAPQLSALDVVSEDDDSDESVSEITEGETVTINATVTDTNVQSVKAVFEHSNGTTATLEDEEGTYSELELDHAPTDDNPDNYNVTKELVGAVGDFDVRIVASDGQLESDDSTSLTINELAKTVDIEKYVLNGVGGFPAGPNAPVYEGTAEDPDNYVNASTNITDTGIPESTEGKFARLIGPDGDIETEAPVNNVTVCMVSQPVGDAQTEEGSTCVDNPDVQSEWTEFWWNSTYPVADQDPIEIDWVGDVTIEFNVTDEFGRNSSDTNATGEILDKLNDNGERAPILENATFTNGTIAPGDTISASAEVRDSLRVEQVFLQMTKPDGTQAVANLTLKQVENATTRNGTYKATFEAGADNTFGQGGVYNDLQLVAEDFARNTTSTDTDTLIVEDDEKPTIETFFTQPRDAVEVGGIVDNTQVKPPTLQVTSRGQLGSLDPIEMEFNESTGRWVTPEPVTANQEGTWRYNIQVADYADNEVTQEDTIEVAANLGPQAQNWQPDALSVEETAFGPPDPMISLELVDPGTGVDSDSIEMLVNDEDVTSQVQQTEIPSTCTDCFELQYTPTEAFVDGETVDVEVNADDQSDDPVSATNVGNYTVDATPPTPSLTMSPSVVSDDRQVIGLPTTINVSASDAGSGASRAKVTATFVGQTGTSPSQTITFEGAEGDVQLQNLEEAFKGHGVYELAITARDKVGNTAEEETRRVLYDDAGPNVEVFGRPGQPREFVFANVTDDAPVEEVTATYTVNGGPNQQLELEQRNGTWSVRLFNQRTGDPFQENVTVRFTVEATDRFGNTGASTQKTFTAGDSVPSVDITNPSAGAELAGSANLAWDASDVETPSNQLRISLFYKKPGGSFKEIPDAQDLENAGSYNLDTTLLPNGDVVLQVIVFDGTNFGADTVKVQVRNLGESFNSPQIQAAQISGGQPTVRPSEDTTFRVQIDGNVQQAFANVTRNGTLVESIELQKADGKTWESGFTTPSEPGNYSITLFAKTSEGPKKAVDAYGFEVQGEPAGGESFIPEWTLLTLLTGGSVAVGVLGLKRKWT
jgi:hypothetical protein